MIMPQLFRQGKKGNLNKKSFDFHYSEKMFLIYFIFLFIDCALFIHFNPFTSVKFK